MKRPRSAFGLLLIPLAALLSACGLPLGPGYTVKRQQLEVRWTSAAELEVRGAYRLQNTGQGPLDYIEVTLPEEPRRRGLQVSFDGAPVATESAGELTPAGTVRIPVRPALAQKKKRDLVIEYRLAESVADASATPSFYLETRGWYPQLREPEGLFGAGGDPPEKWELRITVPRDFLVHAPGQAKGKKRRKESVEHRFRQRRGKHSDPFVVAGRYQEQRAPSPGSDVILWTFQPVQESTVRAFSDRVGQTARQYEIAFGRLGEPAGILLAERPPEVTLREDRATFPGGVFLSTGAGGGAIGEFGNSWRQLDEQLVLIWFHHRVTPAPDARLLFAEGLPPYAATIAAEAQGDSGDRERLASARLGLYEDMGGENQEPRYFLNEPADSAQRMAYAHAKGPLFFLALEDRYGKESTRRALGRLVDSLRGRQFNTNDLRVAIQLETGEDPAEFFRLWLNQAGIPEEFRQRYEKEVPGSR